MRSMRLSSSRATSVTRPATPSAVGLVCRALPIRAGSSVDRKSSAMQPHSRLIKTRAAETKQVQAPAEVEADATPVTAADKCPMPDLPVVAYEDAIMFQAFGWESCHNGDWYGVVKSKVQELKDAGITHVWLPPPSSSPVAPQGYMPGQLYNLTSKYGNEEQLQALNRELRKVGIAPMGDIVINHRCACEQSVDGTWNKFGDDRDHEGHDLDWDKWAITGNDPVFKGTGNPDTGEDFGPAPDLDHANSYLREALTHWLEYLAKDVGFAGWRFDYVKGYGAQFIPEYTLSSVGPQSVNVGEFWTDLQWNGSDLDTNQDGARQKLCDWIDGAGKNAAAFDFPTKGVLQEAAKHTQYNRLKDGNNKAPGLIGWWPKMAVTFVDNHDTGSTQAHWPFPSELVGLGYAYILTHPGIPCLFWEHFYDWGSEMKATILNLLAIRKRNGIRSDSKLEILCAEGDMYAACIDGKVMVKLGPRYDMGSLLPSPEQWEKVAKGKDFCVWEKKA